MYSKPRSSSLGGKAGLRDIVRRVAVVLVLVFAALCLRVGNVSSQNSSDPSVAAAAALLEQGKVVAAERMAREALLLFPDEKSEGFRVLGLALFYQGRLPEARVVFLDYLRRSPEAHLDPALVTPEAVALFEDVRLRHAGELEALRPKPERKRYFSLNLVPGGGQFQNGERGKGIALVSGMGILLATNIASYYWLTSRCDSVTRVCGGIEESRAGDARKIKVVNRLSGTLLIAAYLYSVVDGYLGYRRRGHRENMKPSRHLNMTILSTGDRVGLGWNGKF